MKTNTILDPNNFCLVLASDDKYLLYLRTAILSIRRQDSEVPIHLYSCNTFNQDFLGHPNNFFHQVKIPAKLAEAFSDSNLDHALTRIAKLEAMKSKNAKIMMYIDSDTIALNNLTEITKELPVEPKQNTVYLLLRRPGLLSVSDISWLYFKNVANLNPKEMTDLVNDTFETNYDSEEFMGLNCFNGGVIYGSTRAVNILADLWQKQYLKMLTGKNRDHFIPNDQLCLWIAADQLKKQLDIKELPLKWNFMPGHALTEVMTKSNISPTEIKNNLKDINLLHLAQNKTDIWAQILINEINQ